MVFSSSDLADKDDDGDDGKGHGVMGVEGVMLVDERYRSKRSLSLRISACSWRTFPLASSLTTALFLIILALRAKFRVERVSPKHLKEPCDQQMQSHESHMKTTMLHHFFTVHNIPCTRMNVGNKVGLSIASKRVL